MIALDRGTKVLGALNACLLAGVVGVSVWMLRIERLEMPPVAEVVDGHLLNLSRGDLSIAGFEARPLFSESRKPATEAAVQKGAEAVAAAPPPVFVGALRESAGRRCGFFEGSSGKKMVCVGGSFDGWKVVKVEPKTVTLSLADQVREVPLSFESRGAPSPGGK